MALQIIYSILMAIGGMLIIAWYNGLTTPKTGNFSFAIFFNENYPAFAYSVVGVALILAIVGIAPDVAAWIKTITGFEIKVPVDNGGAVFIGGLIYELVRKSFKK